MPVIVAAIVSAVVFAGSVIATVATAIWAAVSAISAVVWSVLSATGTFIYSTMKGAAEVVIAGVTAINDTIIEPIRGGINYIRPWIKRVADFYKTELGKLTVQTIGFIVGARDSIKINLGNIIGAIGQVSGAIGIEWAEDLARHAEKLAGWAYDIASGSEEFILRAIADLYSAVAGTAEGTITLIAEVVDGIYKELFDTQEGLKDMLDDKLKEWIAPAVTLGDKIALEMKPTMDVLRGDIELELTRVKGEIQFSVSAVQSTMDAIMLRIEDVELFSKMFIKMTEEYFG